jgi:hypothetical protein
LDADNDNEHFSSHTESKNPQPFNQSKLNNMVCDLGLTKEKRKLLGSRLTQKSLFAPRTTFFWYRNCEEQFKKFFIKEGELVYCCDIPGFIHRLGGAYEPDNWRLFIDLSQKKFNCCATKQ